MRKAIALKVEELEERIAPGFVLTGTPGENAEPVGPRDDGTFGPSTEGGEHPSLKNGLGAWHSHDNSPVLENGGT